MHISNLVMCNLQKEDEDFAVLLHTAQGYEHWNIFLVSDELKFLTVDFVHFPKRLISQNLLKIWKILSKEKIYKSRLLLQQHFIFYYFLFVQDLYS